MIIIIPTENFDGTRSHADHFNSVIPENKSEFTDLDDQQHPKHDDRLRSLGSQSDNKWEPDGCWYQQVGTSKCPELRYAGHVTEDGPESENGTEKPQCLKFMILVDWLITLKGEVYR